MLFTDNCCEGGIGERGLSDEGGTGGGEGVGTGGGSALSVFEVGGMKDALLPDIKPCNLWLVLIVLLLVGGLGGVIFVDGGASTFAFALLELPELPLPLRGMDFSATKVSSIPVGAPTFLRTASF